MTKSTAYPEVLRRIQGGAHFLDLGCCLGQEIRKLVHDGAPSAHTYGADLHGGFFAAGYDLFGDKDHLQTTFIEADIFNDASPLRALYGRMDIVYTGDLFHLFGLDEQERIARKVVKLLVPRPGAMVLGRQTGSAVPGNHARAGDTSGRQHFRHNANSWRELWGRVGDMTGSEWAVEAELTGAEFAATAGEPGKAQPIVGSKALEYIITRVR